MNTIDLKKLREDTDKVIAGLSPKRVNGAINWGDLSCVCARYWADDQGNSGLAVIVEEASPGEGELIAAIQNGLARMGYAAHIEVVTEW